MLSLVSRQSVVKIESHSLAKLSSGLVELGLQFQGFSFDDVEDFFGLEIWFVHHAEGSHDGQHLVRVSVLLLNAGLADGLHDLGKQRLGYLSLFLTVESKDDPGAMSDHVIVDVVLAVELLVASQLLVLNFNIDRLAHFIQHLRLTMLDVCKPTAVVKDLAFFGLKLAVTVSQIVLPVSDVLVSISVGLLALAMAEAGQEVSFIDSSICIVALAPAMISLSITWPS